MQIELSVAASQSEVNYFMENLESRGFELRKNENFSIKMSKCYEDATTGEFKARINVSAYSMNDGGDYEYSLYVETHAHDSVTGANVAEGNSFEMATQNNSRCTQHVYFLDSIMMQGACIQKKELPVNGD